MDSNGNPKQQLVERLKSANNILVTVSRNPSVDQLAACIGLTLVLNKLGKHATAVFSGQVPSTIEFLKPDETLEKNTDSLRDFIIALDKSKADKLRYKVEDTVVKIFITPYRTSLSADDLEFSQGDFNVDAVVAIGVQQQQDLDDAITAHGRILHDAVVTTINTAADGNLGTINWHDPSASSLCELVEELVGDLGDNLLDAQIATALLTGIVAETERFSNDKTSPQTMNVSAALMSAGANQQLVASEIGAKDNTHEAEDKSQESSNDADTKEPMEPPVDPPRNNDGTLEITHQHDEELPEDPDFNEQDSVNSPDSEVLPEPDTKTDQELTDNTKVEEATTSRLITEPPVLGGTLTANSKIDTEIETPTDPLSQGTNTQDRPILTHNDSASQTEAVMQPAPADWTPPTPPLPATESAMPTMDLPQPAHEEPVNDVAPEPQEASQEEPVADQAQETLSQLEKDVDSPHLQTPPDLNAARSEVMDAIKNLPPAAPEPIQALNAQTVDLDLHNQDHETAPAPPVSTEFNPHEFGVTNDPDVPSTEVPQNNAVSPLTLPIEQPLPPLPFSPPAAAEPQPVVGDPTIPPVPPPLPPSVYAPPNIPHQ